MVKKTQLRRVLKTCPTILNRYCNNTIYVVIKFNQSKRNKIFHQFLCFYLFIQKCNNHNTIKIQGSISVIIPSHFPQHKQTIYLFTSHRKKLSGPTLIPDSYLPKTHRLGIQSDSVFLQLLLAHF